MFGVFKSPPFHDPQLGLLTRSGGHWRGTLALGSGAAVPLALSGARTAPDAQALMAAHALLAQFESWRPAIEAALFAHHAACADAVAAGEGPTPNAEVLHIATPGDVWPQVSTAFVCVAPLGGVMTVEIGYAVAWDEQHMLGARFQAGRLIELCGSVLPP